jgi:protein TonB
VAGPVAAVDPDPPPRVDFDDAMTPPRLVAGPDIQYTREAIDGEVEGLMIVRCVVTVDGVVHGCRVVKGLPFMDRAVVDALERRRYAPALLHGRPLDVNYTFRIKLMMPR